MPEDTKQEAENYGISSIHFLLPPMSPLHHAICSNNAAEVARLIRQKCDLNVKNTDGYTPLHMAAFLGDVDIVVTLLANNNRVLSPCNKGNNPLHSILSTLLSLKKEQEGLKKKPTKEIHPKKRDTGHSANNSTKDSSIPPRELQQEIDNRLKIFQLLYEHATKNEPGPKQYAFMHVKNEAGKTPGEFAEELQNPVIASLRVDEKKLAAEDLAQRERLAAKDFAQREEDANKAAKALLAEEEAKPEGAVQRGRTRKKKNKKQRASGDSIPPITSSIPRTSCLATRNQDDDHKEAELKARKEAAEYARELNDNACLLCALWFAFIEKSPHANTEEIDLNNDIFTRYIYAMWPSISNSESSSMTTLKQPDQLLTAAYASPFATVLSNPKTEEYYYNIGKLQSSC